MQYYPLEYDTTYKIDTRCFAHKEVIFLVGANSKQKGMTRIRDNKGRFVKGNEIGAENRAKPFTKDNASEMGKKGAARSNEVQARNKLIREVLMEELNKEVTPGVTKREAVVAAVVKNLYDKPSAKGLKILAEISGEMEINVNLLQSDKPMIVFDDDDE